MGVQTARSSTVARPFMRLKPQNIAVQVPIDPADAEASLPLWLETCRQEMCTCLVLELDPCTHDSGCRLVFPVRSPGPPFLVARPWNFW